MFDIDPMDLPNACCPEMSHAQRVRATAIDAVAIGAEVIGLDAGDCVLLLRVMAGFLGGWKRNGHAGRSLQQPLRKFC